MGSRFDHLLGGALTTELKSQDASTPLVIKDNNCPIYAYINSLRSKSSQYTVRRVLQSIAKKIEQPSFYHINWSRFDRNTLNSLVKVLDEENLSNETIKLYLSVTKSVLREAYLMGQIDTLHWERAKSVTQPSSAIRREHPTLTEQDFDDLLVHIDKVAGSKAKAIRDKAIFHLLIGCGLRRFELINLQLDNVDFSTNTLTFDGKGRKERFVTVHPFTMKALNNWMDLRGHKAGFVFTRVNKSGTVHSSIDQNAVGKVEGLTTNAIYILCETYGLLQKGIAPHSLRRSYATILSGNGANLQYIAKLMGHSSIKTTEIYIKSDRKEVENTVLNKLFSNAKG